MITYNQFAEKQGVAIPIIQRDYVQGLDGNFTKRDKFINKILEALDSRQKFEERSLHRLLANAMLSDGVLLKTIFHEKSIKSDSAKWVHPDMVGVRFNEFQDKVTRTLLKAADTKEYLEVYSFVSAAFSKVLVTLS